MTEDTAPNTTATAPDSTATTTPAAPSEPFKFLRNASSRLIDFYMPERCVSVSVDCSAQYYQIIHFLYDRSVRELSISAAVESEIFYKYCMECVYFHQQHCDGGRTNFRPGSCISYVSPKFEYRQTEVNLYPHILSFSTDVDGSDNRAWFRLIDDSQDHDNIKHYEVYPYTLLNVYDDARVCLGNSRLVRDSHYSAAADRFFASRFNSDIMPVGWTEKAVKWAQKHNLDLIKNHHSRLNYTSLANYFGESKYLRVLNSSYIVAPYTTTRLLFLRPRSGDTIVSYSMLREPGVNVEDLSTVFTNSNYNFTIGYELSHTPGRFTFTDPEKSYSLVELSELGMLV